VLLSSNDDGVIRGPMPLAVRVSVDLITSRPRWAVNPPDHRGRRAQPMVLPGGRGAVLRREQCIRRHMEPD
jgi:hypothetical protein